MKLKDADLIGIPLRVVIGERKIAEGKMEVRRRSEKTAEDVPLDKALQFVQDLLAKKR